MKRALLLLVLAIPLLGASCPNNGVLFPTESPQLVVYVEVSDAVTGQPLVANAKYWFTGKIETAVVQKTKTDGTTAFFVPYKTRDSHMWVTAEGYIGSDQYVNAISGKIVKFKLQKTIPDPPAMPTRAEVLANLKADICMRDDGDTSSYPVDKPGSWEVLGKSDEQWSAWSKKYITAGHKLVVSSIRVNGYLGTTYDLSTDLQLLQKRLDRVTASGLIPMPDVTFWDEGSSIDWVKYEQILGAIKGHAPSVFFGWEITVDGSRSLWPTGSDLLKGIRLARQILGPDVVLGIEFNTDDNRSEPITWDGRVSPSGNDYYSKTDAREIDVLMLRLPYSITSDLKRTADEVGGAICRFTGLFPHPTRWPDGSEIPEAVRSNWRTDYRLVKPLRVMVFEYASYLRWSSSKKRELRLFLQQVFPMLAGYGEG